MIKLKSIVKEIFDANLLENNVEITIYCDMDGVLCDFEKQFETLTNTPPKEFEAFRVVSPLPLPVNVPPE